MQPAYSAKRKGFQSAVLKGSACSHCEAACPGSFYRPAAAVARNSPRVTI
jgi:hypothetical protein